VHKVAVNEDQARTIVALFDDMGVPDFFVQCLRCGHNKNAIELIATKSSEVTIVALQYSAICV
jgi:hypothetical protein